MDSTDGLTRGQTVTDKGSQIRVPVGPKTLGRIMNVNGEPIDERGPIGPNDTATIHADPHSSAHPTTASHILLHVITVLALHPMHTRTQRTDGGHACQQPDEH